MPASRRKGDHVRLHSHNDASPSVSTAALPFAPRYRRWPAVLGATGAFLLVVIVSCEAVGWPFLAEPIQRWLSDSLHRRVSFAIDGNTPASVVVRLFGRVRVEAPLINIGPPAWSKSRHMLHASDAVISFHYVDLWRAWRGEPLRIRMLEAEELDADIERLADGRASWQFGPLPPASDREAHSFQLPLFGELKVRGGSLHWRDAVSDVRMTLGCRASEARDEVADAPAGLSCHARGTWHKEPVSMVMQTVSAMPWVNGDASVERTPLTLDATVGDTHVVLQGSALDVLRLGALNARFEAEGTSISTLAKALGLTLSPRAPFRAKGNFAKDGPLWRVTLDRLELGTSELAGRFVLDRDRAVPLLSGKLEGARLTWGDIAESPLPAPAHEKQSLDVPAFRTVDAHLAVDVTQADFGAGVLPGPVRGEWRLSGGRIAWTPTNGGGK